MKQQRIQAGFVLVLAVIMALAFQVLSALALQPPPTHYLKIVKVNSKWLVVQEGDTLTGPVSVQRGEKVVWTSDSSDVFFQFLDSKLFGGFTKKLKAGHRLTLVVGNAAKRGINYYAVFVLKDQQFAEGGSPPAVVVN